MVHMYTCTVCTDTHMVCTATRTVYEYDTQGYEDGTHTGYTVHALAIKLTIT